MICLEKDAWPIVQWRYYSSKANYRWVLPSPSCLDRESGQSLSNTWCLVFFFVPPCMMPSFFFTWKSRKHNNTQLMWYICFIDGMALHCLLSLLLRVFVHFLNPSSTAVSFRERFTQISSNLSPKRDCGTINTRVKYYCGSITACHHPPT